MDGIGEKLVEQLLDSDLISSIAGLYELNQNQLTSLERMGDKSANNVLRELERTKQMTLGKFIHALGLPGIGPELATLFASHVNNLDGLFQWLDSAHATIGDEKFGPELNDLGKPHTTNLAIRNLCKHDGIGEKVAIQVRDGLEQRRDLIVQLVQYLILNDEPEIASTGSFEGMTFCITGTLSQPRKTIQLMVKNAGGKVVGSISSKLSVLIAGENAGSKLAKAQTLGVEIWDEDLLNQKLNSGEKQITDEQSEEKSANAQRTLTDF